MPKSVILRETRGCQSGQIAGVERIGTDIDSIASPRANNATRFSIQKTAEQKRRQRESYRIRLRRGRDRIRSSGHTHETALGTEVGVSVAVYRNLESQVDEGVAQGQDDVDREERQEPEGEDADELEALASGADRADERHPSEKGEEGDVEGEDNLQADERRSATERGRAGEKGRDKNPRSRSAQPRD